MTVVSPGVATGGDIGMRFPYSQRWFPYSQRWFPYPRSGMPLTSRGWPPDSRHRGKCWARRDAENV